uniref:Uncharacterized protein n=1 Tax=Magallana gigas TaxID=29159 RepID=A0A8W8MH20_MAGGI
MKQLIFDISCPIDTRSCTILSTISLCQVPFNKKQLDRTNTCSVQHCSDQQNLIERSNSRRKELTLESLDGQDIIICNLLGETADLVVPPIDSIITATCVQVAVWKGTVSLNSTNLTKLRETDEERNRRVGNP